MSYCINPKCFQRHNPDDLNYCQTCGAALLIQGRYRLLRPLRALDDWEPSELFEVLDEQHPQQPTRVLKLLKKPLLLPQFEREASTLQRLNHPGIPQVAADGYFAWSPKETARLPESSTPLLDAAAASLQVRSPQLHCLVMEKIQGDNLENWLRREGPIDAATAQNWLRQLAELLEQLHQAGLFHRDIKLSNLMLRPTGQLALIDFGSVRPMDQTYFAKVAGQRDITSVVSPGYTPLEQMNGKAVPQSDFYALGRSLIHLLTGQHPIELPQDESTGHLLWRDRTVHEMPEALAQLLDDMMAPFPGQRPLHAAALLERLQPQPSAKIESPIPATERPKYKPQAVIIRWAIAVNLILLLLQCWVGWKWLEARQQQGQGRWPLPSLEPMVSESMVPESIAPESMNSECTLARSRAVSCSRKVMSLHRRSRANRVRPYRNNRV